MKRHLLFAGALALASNLGAATINGKVMFQSKRGQQPVVNETLVWLDPAGKTWKKPAATFTMTTRSKEFLAHVVAVPARCPVPRRARCKA